MVFNSPENVSVSGNKEEGNGWECEDHVQSHDIKESCEVGRHEHVVQNDGHVSVFDVFELKAATTEDVSILEFVLFGQRLSKLQVALLTELCSVGQML